MLITWFRGLIYQRWLGIIISSILLGSMVELWNVREPLLFLIFNNFNYYVELERYNRHISHMLITEIRKTRNTFRFKIIMRNGKKHNFKFDHCRKFVYNTICIVIVQPIGFQPECHSTLGCREPILKVLSNFFKYITIINIFYNFKKKKMTLWKISVCV